MLLLVHLEFHLILSLLFHFQVLNEVLEYAEKENNTIDCIILSIYLTFSNNLA